MGLFDLSLDKLYHYQGINPKPENFDSYWDSALAEMEEIEPKIELKEAAYYHPAVECFDLWFTGTKQARVYAKYARPKGKTGPSPALLFFHGYAGKSSEWTNICAWASAGFCVAFLDVRGQGGKSQDVGGVKGNTLHGHIIRGLDSKSPDDLFFRDVFLDTALLAKIVSSFDEVDENRLGAKGGSQGGALTLACAALSNIKAAAADYPFLSDYQRVWEMDLALNSYVELKEYFRHFDPMHKREKEIFTRLGYIDIQHLASRITGKVQMYTGLMDQICPPSSQFACYNKIPTEKEVFIYPDFAHENLPGHEDQIMQWFIKELKP